MFTARRTALIAFPLLVLFLMFAGCSADKPFIVEPGMKSVTIHVAGMT